MQRKTTDYKALQITPRNTTVTWRFVILSRMTRPASCCSKASDRVRFSEPRKILLTVQSDSRFVRAGAHNSRDGNQPAFPRNRWCTMREEAPASSPPRSAAVPEHQTAPASRFRSRTQLPRSRVDYATRITGVATNARGGNSGISIRWRWRNDCGKQDTGAARATAISPSSYNARATFA